MAQSPKSRDEPFYFVCNCGAKFFHGEAAVECPRCGEALNSSERIRPPWRIKLLTVRQVAEILAISQSKVYELIEGGDLSHHRMGGAIRISEEQIQEYLEGTKQGRREPEPRKSKPPRPNLRHIKL